MCNISLLSPLSCGFPLGPDSLLHRAYSSTTSLCVHLSALQSFALRAHVCVYRLRHQNDTGTFLWPEWDYTVQSCRERERLNKEKSEGLKFNHWV